MSSSLHRKFQRSGVQRAEANARRLFQVALGKVEALEATFLETLNELPFRRRVALAFRLLAGRLRKSIDAGKKEPAKAPAVAQKQQKGGKA